MNRELRLFSLILATVLQAAQAAEMYEWRQENGRMITGDRPPSEGIPYKVIPDGEPKPPKKYRAFVAPSDRGPVRPGMTEENALEAWGWPRQVNKTTTVGGVREQWVYEFGRRHDYIYLENGVVTSIQEQAAIVLNLF